MVKKTILRLAPGRASMPVIIGKKVAGYSYINILRTDTQKRNMKGIIRNHAGYRAQTVIACLGDPGVPDPAGKVSCRHPYYCVQDTLRVR
jgi:hypothetical protein